MRTRPVTKTTMGGFTSKCFPCLFKTGGGDVDDTASSTTNIEDDIDRIIKNYEESKREQEERENNTVPKQVSLSPQRPLTCFYCSRGHDEAMKFMMIGPVCKDCYKLYYS